MRISAFALAALVLMDPAARSQPMAPTNPVELACEVGSVASADGGAVTLFVKGRVTKQGATFYTVWTMASQGTGTRLSHEVLGGLIEALPATLAKPDEDFVKEGEEPNKKRAMRSFNSFAVKNSEREGKRSIAISMGSGGGPGITTAHFDIDNAGALLKLLKKAQGIEEWMKTKASALQK